MQKIEMKELTCKILLYAFVLLVIYMFGNPANAQSVIYKSPFDSQGKPHPRLSYNSVKKKKLVIAEKPAKQAIQKKKEEKKKLDPLEESYRLTMQAQKILDEEMKKELTDEEYEAYFAPIPEKKRGFFAKLFGGKKND